MSRIDPERWKAIAPHFDRLMDLPTSARPSWLDALRAEDQQLAEELREFLADLAGLSEEAFLDHGLSSFHAGQARRDPDSPAELDGPRYELGEELARGGMGRIVRTRDNHLGRTVAIKELLSADADAEARFDREAKLTARLQHPSIVPLYDAGRWRDTQQAFYSMKLVNGAPISDLVRAADGLHARLALLPHLLAAADALAYAHSESVIHRDIKPANILVGAFGETLVVDWGLAKDLSRMEPAEPAPIAEAEPEHRIQATMTQAGAVLGTLQYMPPEQARGEPVDARADVYSLGATLYFVITARPPYEVSARSRAASGVLAGPPPRISSLERAAPLELCAIAEKAMARHTSDRYPSARELAADLRQFLTGRMVSAHDYSWFQLLAGWLRRNRTLALVSLLSLLMLVASAGAFLVREQRLRRLAEASSRRADAQSRALLLEHGRRELAVGRPLRAAVYLAEAYLRAPQSEVLQHLITDAVRPLRAHARKLSGHTREIIAVAFSSDGARLVTGSTDQTVRLWDTASGRPLRVLRGAPSSVEDVAISHDGTRIASVEDVVCIWDAESGALLRTLPSRGFRVQFSRDDKWLVTGSGNGTLRVWDTADYRLVHELRPHRDRISAIAFHPSGERAVTVSWDGLVKFWELPSWRPIATLDDHRNTLSTAAYSADGRWLLTGDYDHTLFVRDARDGVLQHVIRLPEGARAMNAFFANDGRSIVTTTFDGVIRVWHATSGAPLQAIDAIPDGKLYDGALSPDGRTVATVGVDSVDLWRIDQSAGYRILRGDRHDGPTVAPAILSRDGRWIMASVGIGIDYGQDHRLHIWNAVSGAEVGSLRAAGSGYRLAASADLTRAASGYGRNVTAIYDTSTGGTVATLDYAGQWVRALAMSPDGRLVAHGGDLGEVRLWRDGVRSRIETDVVPPETLSTMIFGPRAGELTVADSRGFVSRYDLESGRRTFQLKAGSTQIEDVRYSADGRWLITAGRQDHTARVWDAVTGDLRATLTGHTDNLIQASFNPDATRVATVSVDNTARIWNARSGELLRVIRGPAYSALFGPDGRELITTGVGDYMVAWDVSLETRSPTELARLVQERSPWELHDGRLQLRDGMQRAR